MRWWATPPSQGGSAGSNPVGATTEHQHNTAADLYERRSAAALYVRRPQSSPAVGGYLCPVPASFHAAVVGRSEANCRQIALRARRQVEARKPRFEASRRRRKELARRFLEAVGQGDTEGLVGLLAADVVTCATPPRAGRSTSAGLRVS
jgi:hypothetical protein